jgi:exonuclease III
MMDPSIISSSSTLRMGTFNIGLAIQRKLPIILTRCSTLSLDVVAVQEIGDPALLENRFSSYHFIYAAGPSHHQAGVGLLLSQTLIPRIRSYHRSTSGRLIGAVLELNKGHQLLIVSAYMPSGLDHCSSDSPQHEMANKLYTEIIRWSVDVQQVIVMGDLNETLTRYDRQPRPDAAPIHPHSPMRCLIDEGYTDVWRYLHPSAEHQPGFTHVISGARPSRSRLDYLWCKGFNTHTLSEIHIDNTLRALSHHSLLWMEVELDHSAPTPPVAPVSRLRTPNLRSLTPFHKQSLGKAITRDLLEHQHQIREELELDQPHSLNDIATYLTQMVHTHAFDLLPLTGDKPLHNRCILQLQRQRQDLTRLLSLSKFLLDTAPPHLHGHCHCFASSPEWRKQQRLCANLHQLEWMTDVRYAGAAKYWLDETRQMLRNTRTAIRQEQKRMIRSRKPNLDVNPAAMVHRMLKSDALPNQLLSVVDNNGDLTSNASDLEDVMVDHFTSVFAVPPPDGIALPHPVPDMLLDKVTVQPEWFDTLMTAVSTDELLAITADTPLISAAGQDEVSSGLWKLALQESELLRSLVALLFSSCLRTSSFPTAWKTSIIVPLVKDAQKERTMSNVRPISLQSCLGKLLNKLLAHRLSDTFARHPILHPAQRGFINGGTITKCIDELLDAWDWSRTGKREQYTLLYDIKQAYDSVQVDVIERALLRLLLPASFIALVVDSLTGLSSCVRTAYGLSRTFRVERSLRQGDPLAPLLFVILMDALHDGLERNPFTGQHHGLRMELHDGVTMVVPSLGYADDTSVLTNTLFDLRQQNDWVHYFMAFNRMRLNHSKCELIGRGVDGEPVTATALAAHGITIDGHPLQPVPHDQSIRYLGVHMRFDGNWVDQKNKAIQTTAMFTRAVIKFDVTLKQAVYMFNVFLMPMLELALHYMHGPEADDCFRKCDRLIIGSIKHAVNSPLQLSHSAVALSIGLLLPSWLETSVKVSELFLRMNDSDARWGELGRVLMRQSSSNSRAAHLAEQNLGWELHLTERQRAGRRQHLFKQDVDARTRPECSASTPCQLAAGLGPVHLAHDHWRGFGPSAPPQEVHVYTDGSFDPLSTPVPTSAWAVTVSEQWLEDNYGSIPSDEKVLRAYHVGGAVLLGASIQCTRGIYPAELQAIARALAMFPASFALHIHSDSQASLKAIQAYESLSNERKRMRMAARTLLQLIHHLLQVRASAGGSVQWHHISAHSSLDDIHSVGNRLSDYQANLSRCSVHPTPSTLEELPLSACEPHLTIINNSGVQLIDDVRSTALSQIKQSALSHWQEKRDGREYFASEAAVTLGRVVIQHGSKQQQCTLVHVATNSIQYHYAPSAGPGTPSALKQLRCEDCDVILTLAHLAECRSQLGIRYRHDLKIAILDLFGDNHQTSHWINSHGGAPLPSVLLNLFPMPSAVAKSRPGSEERLRHLTYAMCGVITQSQATSAAKAIGFSDKRDVDLGQRVLSKFRLLCLDSIQQLFDDLKSTGVR